MKVQHAGLTCAVFALVISVVRSQSWFRNFNFNSPMQYRPDMMQGTYHRGPEPMQAPIQPVYSPFWHQRSPSPAVVVQSRPRTQARVPEVIVSPPVPSSSAPRVILRPSPVVRARQAIQVPQVQAVQRPPRRNPISAVNPLGSGWGQDLASGLGGIMGGGIGGIGGTRMGGVWGIGGWDAASDVMDARHDFASDVYDSYSDRWDYT